MKLSHRPTHYPIGSFSHIQHGWVAFPPEWSPETVGRLCGRRSMQDSHYPESCPAHRHQARQVSSVSHAGCPARQTSPGLWACPPRSPAWKSSVKATVLSRSVWCLGLGLGKLYGNFKRKTYWGKSTTKLSTTGVGRCRNHTTIK